MIPIVLSFCVKTRGIITRDACHILYMVQIFHSSSPYISNVFFGDKINLAICASLGCSISMGTMKSKYSVIDAYNGAVIKSSSESIHAPAMFSATIGLVWSFSSWRRSKK